MAPKRRNERLFSSSASSAAIDFPVWASTWLRKALSWFSFTPKPRAAAAAAAFSLPQGVDVHRIEDEGLPEQLAAEEDVVQHLRVALELVAVPLVERQCVLCGLDPRGSYCGLRRDA